MDQAAVQPPQPPQLSRSGGALGEGSNLNLVAAALRRLQQRRHHRKVAARLHGAAGRGGVGGSRLERMAVEHEAAQAGHATRAPCQPVPPQVT